MFTWVFFTSGEMVRNPEKRFANYPGNGLSGPCKSREECSPGVAIMVLPGRLLKIFYLFR
jgi:hypothetical protein